MQNRVKNADFAAKIMDADAAAALVPNGALVGFSGFVGAGAPIHLPLAIAKRAEALHAQGKEYKIGALTGASTDPHLDGDLAKANAVSFRSPFMTDRDMRGAINTNETEYMDVHLSSLAQQVEAGFLARWTLLSLKF